jgi:hypothetical protein
MWHDAVFEFGCMFFFPLVDWLMGNAFNGANGMTSHGYIDGILVANHIQSINNDQAVVFSLTL